MQEGELRPQLLDRFGMSVNVVTMQDIAARTQMVLDRMAFEKVQPCTFCAFICMPLCFAGNAVLHACVPTMQP